MYRKLFSDYPKEIINIISGLTELYDKDCSNIILYYMAVLLLINYHIRKLMINMNFIVIWNL